MGDLVGIVSRAMAQREAVLRELEKLRCERSLYDFVRAAWDVLHPGEPMVGGWTMRVICRHLEAVTRGEVDRLLINVPPGFAKSLLVNVFWPAWEWGPQGLAHHKFISTAYEKGLAIRDMMLCRDLLRSEWYQQHWPIEFKQDQDGKEHYANTERGWRFAASVGSGLTGRRGHRLIIDDPHSVKTAESDAERSTARFWFSETTPTRFVDQKRPVYVIIMQRLHETDISGQVINKLADRQGWTHLCIPMEAELKHKSWTKVPVPGQEPQRMRRVKDQGEPIPYYLPDPAGDLLYCQDPRTAEGELAWPERFDQKSVDDLKVQFESEGGSYARDAQLQQRPVPRGGGMFQRGDFEFAEKAPAGRSVRGWDLAATKDDKAAYTVGLKMKLGSDGRVYIEDVVREQASPAGVEAMMTTAAKQDGPNVDQDMPQDPGQAGKVQKAAILKLLHGYPVYFSPETGSKEDRAKPLAAQAEGGNVVLVRGEWNDAFVAEAALFPNGQFKDQIDAASRAYARLVRLPPEEVPAAPVLIGG